MQPWFRKDEDGRWSVEALRSLAITLETAPVGALSGSAAMIKDVADELVELRQAKLALSAKIEVRRGRIVLKGTPCFVDHAGWSDYPAAREGEG